MTEDPHELPAVATKLVTDQVYAILEEQILSGELRGGERLRVRQVAEMVGTSVMPVREAISRLEDTGLAMREPHKGAVVKEYRLDELIDIYAVRLVLEVEAARLGARNVTADGLSTMKYWLAKNREALAARRIPESLVSDSSMLRVLYRASGNEHLCNMIESLWKQCHLYRLTSSQNDSQMRGRRLTLIERTANIYEAVTRGDSAAAAEATRESIEAAIETLIASKPETTAGVSPLAT